MLFSHKILTSSASTILRVAALRSLAVDYSQEFPSVVCLGSERKILWLPGVFTTTTSSCYLLKNTSNIQLLEVPRNNQPGEF